MAKKDPNLVEMKCPAGITCVAVGSENRYPNEDGIVEVPPAFVEELEHHGLIDVRKFQQEATSATREEILEDIEALKKLIKGEKDPRIKQSYVHSLSQKEAQLNLTEETPVRQQKRSRPTLARREA